jgi:fatty acid desaturase
MRVVSFLFPTGRQKLSTDLLRVAFIFAVFLALGWWWGAYQLPLIMGAAFLVGVVFQQLLWHFSPKQPQR